ncbi:MAG: hypothetical protein LC775_12765, partial [Acidobacteria bacterium]|nr:hypothetical protein [Acidobacteriota bacterium]
YMLRASRTLKKTIGHVTELSPRDSVLSDLKVSLPVNSVYSPPSHVSDKLLVMLNLSFNSPQMDAAAESTSRAST